MVTLASLSISFPLISFSCLIALARALRIVLKMFGKMDNLVSFLILVDESGKGALEMVTAV